MTNMIRFALSSPGLGIELVYFQTQRLALTYYALYGFPVLTRAYDNNGRCPRQKFVFGILQLILCANFITPKFNVVM